MNLMEVSELVNYNEQILEYLKNGYELSFYPARQSSCIIIKVAKDGLCLSKIINPTISFMTYFDFSTMYGCILEALTELEKTVNPESEQKHENTKLRVCYLSDDPERIKKAKSIMDGLTRRRKTSCCTNGFATDKAEYIFVRYSEHTAAQLMALGQIDQVIIDRLGPIPSLAESMTTRSRLPIDRQIFDDRSLFNGHLDGLVL